MSNNDNDWFTEMVNTFENQTGIQKGANGKNINDNYLVGDMNLTALTELIDNYIYPNNNGEKLQNMYHY